TKQDEALTENIVSATPEQESSLSEQEEAVPESVRAKGVFEGVMVEPVPTELPDTQFPGQEEQPVTLPPVPGSAPEEVATALEPIEPPAQAPTLAPLTLATGDGLIDLNHATEEEIATLPGIGMIYAKRAVSEREAMGGFQSLEQFAQKLGFKPHVAQRIQHLVTLTPLKKE
ncbi:MAG: helix-hairpin-helix domain-containing protein, partial [Tumebacillaceae bacterium]